MSSPQTACDPTPASSRDPEFSNRNARVLLLLALGLTALVYAGTVNFQFTYDDVPQILHNALIRSAHNVPRFFTQQVWAHMGANETANYYRPLFVTWMWANYALFGLNAAWWHLSTVLVHLITTALVYVVTRQLVRSPLTAAIAALIFGLHPIHVESVAWVSGVTDPLGTMFLLASLSCYLHSREHGRGFMWLVGSAILALCAYFSKETTIVLPALVVAYEWLAGREEGSTAAARMKSALRSAALLTIAAAVFLAARLTVLTGMAHRFEFRPVSVSVLTVPKAFIWYIRKMLWPSPLSVFYDYEWITRAASLQFFAYLLAAALVIAALVVLVRRSATYGFLAIFFLLGLAPALAALPTFINSEMVHDRYLYLPSVAFAIAAAILIQRIRGKASYLFGLPAARAAIIGALTITSALATISASRVWESNLTLFMHAVQIAPRNDNAFNHLAHEMFRRGDRAAAFALYDKSLSIDPKNWITRIAYGITLFDSGLNDKAAQMFESAIAIDPGNANQFWFLGQALERMNMPGEAAQAYEKAAAIWSEPIDPYKVGYNYFAAAALERSGKLDEARIYYRRELAANPNSAETKQRLVALEQALAN